MSLELGSLAFFSRFCCAPIHTHISDRVVLVACPCALRVSQRVHVYEAVSYDGEPAESEEMRPKWFRLTELPLKARLFHRPPFRRSKPDLSAIVTCRGFRTIICFCRTSSHLPSYVVPLLWRPCLPSRCSFSVLRNPSTSRFGSHASVNVRRQTSGIVWHLSTTLVSRFCSVLESITHGGACRETRTSRAGHVGG